MSRRPEKKAPLPVLRDDGPHHDPWYADGLRFGCSVCGNCCTGPPGYVWITDEEITRLAKHLKQDEAVVRETYTRKIGQRISLKEHRNAAGEYDCVFLKPLPGDRPDKRRRGCSIYPVRPLQCRTWPFWDGLLESPEAWQYSKQGCPGMDNPKGRFYDRERIEQLRDADDWPEEPPTSV